MTQQYLPIPYMPPPHPQAQQALPGSTLAMAMHQDGSLQLQRAFNSMAAHDVEALAQELAPHVGMLATHPRGNYIASKLTAVPSAQMAVAESLAGRVIELMQHVHGSRVMQAAFEHLPKLIVKALVDELRTHIVETAMTTNGSWSVVSAFKFTHSAFIVEELADCLALVSTHQHGTRVVQRMLPEAVSHGVETQNIFDALMNIKDLGALASDGYGNYVVQQALRVATVEQCLPLIEKLIPSLPVISTCRGGSSVAETVLRMASPEQVVKATNVLCGHELECHHYGKHVLALLHKTAMAHSQEAACPTETSS